MILEHTNLDHRTEVNGGLPLIAPDSQTPSLSFCNTKADTDGSFYSITHFFQYINGLSIPVGSFFATCVMLWLISSGLVFICVC